MNILHLARILPGQDGVIWNNELFRFDGHGDCVVYDLSKLKKGAVVDLEPVARFTLDKSDLIVPHSNAVTWGKDYFSVDDEFPLLYTNIYNNTSKFNDNLTGTCCVYRLQRDGNTFKTTLLQIIQIRFTEDANLWKAFLDKHGARPFGNFVVDREKGFFHAFVMRNEELGTRHFKFNLPNVNDGEVDNNYKVKRVTLEEKDILEYFDCPYQYFIQGATFHKGRIYSAEGFNDNVNKPAIRIIDVNKKVEESKVDLWKNGYNNEPELIDFVNGDCYYADYAGNLYTIEF